MATAKEIRGRIGSIKSTQKITRAMEMIAASKLRKARNRMEASRPYAERALDIIRHLSQACPEYRHVYMKQRPVKRVGYIVVSTDRGLCGGLNTNLFRMALKSIQQHQAAGAEIEFALIGHRAEVFFKRLTKANIAAYTHHLGDAPKLQDIIGSVKVMLDSFSEERIDKLYLVSNQFVNTIKQKPNLLQLLPLEPLESPKNHWDYIYEPDAKFLLDFLLGRYMESQVYQGVVENIACEQAARMMAMKNATDNAGELIDELKLAYNKARQASITKELAEIVSGAEAV